MHKESIMVLGKRVAINFHPDVPSRVCPTILQEETRGGVRFYVDTIGGRHVADIFDQVWGKRDSKAILPKTKAQFQRIRKM